MKKLFFLIIVLVFSFSFLYTQTNTVGDKVLESIDLASQTQKKTAVKENNTFFDYLKGRSAIGFNFSPAIYIAVTDWAIGKWVIPEIKKIIEDTGLVVANSGITKSAGYGMTFSYDFSVFRFMAIGAEVGFLFSEISVDGINLKYNAIPWEAGIRFFPGGKAPFGFFIYPKMGGMSLTLRGNALDYIDAKNPVRNNALYAAVEIGWRNQLFPRLMANSPVKISLDISLLDIGYYINSWGSGILVNQRINDLFSGWKTFLNFRFILFPRIGFTVAF